MQHQKSNVDIYYTKEYGRFNIMEGNRQLNERKIQRIKSDINDGIDVLKYCPIIVNEKDGRLDIIDGQHRFYVAKEMKSHIWYIVAERLTLQEIAKVNSNTEKWKNADFINCYRAQGNLNYETIDSFMETYRFPLSVSLKLLSEKNIKSEGGIGNMQSFRDGLFKVTSYDKAVAIADIVTQFSAFSSHTSGAFVVAICKIVESGKVPISDVIAAYLDNKDRLKPQANPKDYLTNLEAIINIGKHSRRVIY